jgi:2-polyprenyl-6-methoxyphenol hydroxylase-like FAD-dependent oxidoreductase
MPNKTVDVCIIGAGVAGTACAQGLARQGVSVALLDRLHPLPDCLKAEKIEPEGVLSMLRFGFQSAIDAVATPLHNVTVFFGERALGTLRLDPPEAGMLYHDLVNALRKDLDPRVDFMPGTKATAFEQRPEGVEVVTDKGARIVCKLAIMATGDARHLLEPMGAVYEPQPPHQVFAAAFTFEGSLGDPRAPLDSVTYHHPVPGGPIAYATFFRLGDALRANIFCPGPTGEEWQRDLKHRPLEALSEHSRVLAEAARSWRVASPVITRKMQVVRVTPPGVPRIVVLGDAAHVIDPSGSGGLTFALMEAELLLGHYLPGWLSGDCGPEAIQAFYSDPRRTNAVREFFARGRYIYDLNHDSSLPGRSRRLRFALQHMLTSRLGKRPGRGPSNGQGWHLPAPFIYEQYASGSKTRRGPKRSM